MTAENHEGPSRVEFGRAPNVQAESLILGSHGSICGRGRAPDPKENAESYLFSNLVPAPYHDTPIGKLDRYLTEKE